MLVPHSYAMQCWLAFAERHGLPIIRKLTPKRRAWIRDRWREWSKEGDPYRALDAILLTAEKSPFLMGEGRSGWRMTFDWLFKDPGNSLKILEGAYNDDPPPTRAEDEKERMRRFFGGSADAPG